MRTALLVWFAVALSCVLVRAQEASQADREKAAVLFAAEDFQGAAAAFKAITERDAKDPRAAYNLALSLWRAGDSDAAETAAEKAAALSGGELNPLRDGLIGNLRYDRARALLTEQPPKLDAALSNANKAKTHFMRGALAAKGEARAPIARNLERTLKLIEEIEKQREEQEKKDDEKSDEQNEEDDEEKSEDKKDEEQKDEQQKGDEKNEDENKDENKDEQQQDQQQDENKDDQKQEDQQQSDDQQSEDQKSDEPQPEPSEQEKDSDESKGGTAGDEKSDQQQKQDAPQPPQEMPASELSEEQKKRLLDKLKQLEAQRIEARAAQKRRRPKVERDW